MNAIKKNLKEKFGRVGILTGGSSPEREISLKSGDAVYRALKEAGSECILIDIKNTKNECKLKNNILEHQLDVAFIAMHGDFGEDGQLQAILEQLNIPYTGSSPRACRMAMDKAVSKKIFELNEIKVPKFIITEEENFNYGELKFPLVIKPSGLGSSIGLSIVKEKAEVEPAFLLAKKYDRKIILEEYQAGEEVTVGILEGRAMPVIMLKPREEFYNYKAKYTKGLTEYFVPAPIDPITAASCQAVALNAHRALGLWHFGRVDIILKDREFPLVLEVNSIPGLTPISLLPKAAESEGLSFTQLCIKITESAFK